MIVKNEEKNIARCLECLAPLMDEMIIVDTGSTDRTKEIARHYTERIYDFSWCDDFAKARNAAVQKATMDYIYIADADELLDETNIHRFWQMKQVLLPEIDIVQMKYTNQLEFGTTYNYDVEYRPKLYKRLRPVEFIDPIHETVRIDPIIYDSEIEIIHKPHESHKERDFAMIQTIIKRGDVISKKLHNMYAKELYIAGEEKDFVKAFDFFQKTFSDPTRGMDELTDAICIVTHVYRLKKDIANFFKYCLKNIATQPCSEVCYELGEYYFEKQDMNEAIIWYYNGAFESESHLSIKYSKELPLKRLIQCYELLGDSDNAKQYSEMLKQIEE